MLMASSPAGWPSRFLTPALTSRNAKHSHLMAHSWTSVSSRSTFSTARKEVTIMVESGTGECGSVGSDRMTHTITATSSRMWSHALVCSCGQGVARRRKWVGGVGCAEVGLGSSRRLGCNESRDALRVCSPAAAGHGEQPT